MISLKDQLPDTQKDSKNEAVVMPITHVLRQLLPPGLLNTVSAEKRKQSQKLVADLIDTLNRFYKDHDINIQLR
jgi:hypothetical protein